MDRLAGLPLVSFVACGLVSAAQEPATTTMANQDVQLLVLERRGEIAAFGGAVDSHGQRLRFVARLASLSQGWLRFGSVGAATNRSMRRAWGGPWVIVV